MKKMLVSGLVLFLVFFSVSFGLASCDIEEKETKKVIAEEFRGIWIVEKLNNINVLDANEKLTRYNNIPQNPYSGMRVTENKIEFIVFDNINQNNNITNESKQDYMEDITNAWSNDTTKTIYNGDKDIGTYGANENILNIYGVQPSSMRSTTYIRFNKSMLP